MANIKITDLTAYTDPLNTDVLPIVDVTSDTTKKVSIADLLENAGSGTAAAPGIAFDGDSNTGIYRPGANQLAISTNGTGRLFIDGSGNVTIGAASGAWKLDVPENSIGAQFFRAGSSTGACGIFFDAVGSTDTISIATADNDLKFRTDDGGFLFTNSEDTERLRITSDGKLGLGTSSPQTLLHISSSNNANAGSTNDNMTLRFEDTDTSSGSGGQMMGTIEWFGRDTTSYAAGVRSRIQCYGSAGTQLPLLQYRSRAHNFYVADSGLVSNQTTSALYISPSAQVGIGTTSPGYSLDVNGSINIADNQLIRSGGQAMIARYSGSNAIFVGSGTATDNLVFSAGGNEKARIDTAGRLLVGTSTAFDSNAVFEAVSTNNVIGQFCRTNGVEAAVTIQSTPGTLASPTANNANASIGALYFRGYDSTAWKAGALIKAETDGQAWASGDCPGRLVFSTTADSASSPTEAWRINNQGSLIKTNSTSSEAIADNVTTTILTVGSGNAIVHFDVMFIDGAYRQGVWAGQYTLFVSDAAGAPAVSYYLKEHWQDVGSSNWSAPVVTVAVDSSGNVTLNATNSHSDMNGNAYVYITAITGGNPTITTYT
jgi:hypothetical protein